MSALKVLLQAIREWRLPMIAWSRHDEMRSRCPRCGESITLSLVAVGKRAFKCPVCGEVGTWKADA
jgi:predicted RNA-binding Zn-ribbon protein involved in translation (DUF1610 family)